MEKLIPNQFAGKSGEKDKKSFKRLNKILRIEELYQEVIIELAIILKNSEVMKFFLEGKACF